jgi:CelD/BcsL family acetyltransferase involved in cellulose biosynthesis
MVDRPAPTLRRPSPVETPLDWFVVQDEAGLVELTPEWRRLVASIPRPSIFWTPEWNRVWWRHFGQHRQLHLAGARRAGQLVALAPLCTTQGFAGARIREFLGSEEADLAGLLLAPGEGALAPGLLRFALQDRGWNLCDLWCVPKDSPTAGAWTDTFGSIDSRHAITTLTVNPVLDLTTPSGVEGVRRSLLKNVARKRRGLAREGKLELTFPETVEEVEAALTDLRALHRARWGTRGEISRLDLPDYWSWVRGLVLEAFGSGWLYLPRLRLDGRPVATGIYFLYQRRLFYWIGGFAPALAHRSPYHVLTLSIIEHVTATGAADVLDFGRGDETYKADWTATTLPLLRLMAWRGAAGAAAYLWHGRVRPWAWAHQDWSRPLRRLKRSVGRLHQPAGTPARDSDVAPPGGPDPRGP